MTASWELVPSLVALRDAFNEVAPDRDHASDGSIGDAAHQRRVSDHNPDETGAVPIHDADHLNEVHALDVDSDLRMPGLTMAAVVAFVVARHRAGADDRLRYVIHDHAIWEASNGWRERVYDGSDPHVEHAHFSASYETAREADNRPWHLEEIPVALTADDRKWISAEIAAQTEKIWAQRLDVDTSKAGTNLQPAGSILAYGSSEHHAILDKIDVLAGKVDALTPPPAS